MAYRYVIQPFVQGRQPGVSDPRYDRVVTSRSTRSPATASCGRPAVQDQLKAKRIKLTFVDDKADYAARMAGAERRQVPDGRLHRRLVHPHRRRGSATSPRSIVLVIDETRGADAIVAYKEAVGSIRDLDSPDARFVLTPNSPSEFLARTVVAQFSLPSLPEKWSVEADGAGAVLQAVPRRAASEKRAYVLWEPYVSKALRRARRPGADRQQQAQGLHRRRARGRAQFLSDQPEVAAPLSRPTCAPPTPTRARRTTCSARGRRRPRHGESALEAQAECEKVAAGIQWKNTLENYAHFGLVPPARKRRSPHLEDMIANITDVLVKTEALASDPLAGKVNTVYYDRFLRDLKAQNFHPGTKLTIIQAWAGTPDLGACAPQADLPVLTEQQWNGLAPVGELRIEPILFGRGTAQITVQSQRELESLVKRSAGVPPVLPRGDRQRPRRGRRRGQPPTGAARSDSVAQALVRLGLASQPHHARWPAEPSAQSASAQSVSFVVGPGRRTSRKNGGGFNKRYGGRCCCGRSRAPRPWCRLWRA